MPENLCSLLARCLITNFLNHCHSGRYILLTVDTCIYDVRTEQWKHYKQGPTRGDYSSYIGLL